MFSFCLQVTCNGCIQEGTGSFQTSMQFRIVGNDDSADMVPVSHSLFGRYYCQPLLEWMQNHLAVSDSVSGQLAISIPALAGQAHLPPFNSIDAHMPSSVFRAACPGLRRSRPCMQAACVPTLSPQPEQHCNIPEPGNNRHSTSFDLENHDASMSMFLLCGCPCLSAKIGCGAVWWQLLWFFQLQLWIGISPSARCVLRHQFWRVLQLPRHPSQ